MNKKSLRTSFALIGVLLIVTVAFAACTRSAGGPVPTPESKVDQGSQAAGTATPGVTVVAADATATPQEGVTPAPLPTMTPTSESGGELPTPTPTTESGGDAAPTPTPPAEPTAPPVPGDDADFEYTVGAGDTLWGLAIRFGTTVEAIKSKNGLTSDVIYKGQKLILPGTGDGGGETITHVVQPGENLFRIALKYNTTVEAVAAANNIVNPSFVYAGQNLVIVQGSGTTPVSGVRYHVVQRGESLWSIALKYNTTAWAIANYNGISNINFIIAGRTLRIP
ncbi:MAG: LysM peptidoglycan-binding domain-containing protein [Anaerolineae bacterium]|nr:LysM peptidoglycan-binding domain-containing protein [Anaerolineae bacterium]